MQLSRQQKIQFRDEGYIVIPGAVSRLMVDDALRAINHSLGEEGMSKDDLPRLRAQSYCNEVQKTRTITDLLNNSPVFPLVESLVGEGNLQPVGAGQIALRFPPIPPTTPVHRAATSTDSALVSTAVPRAPITAVLPVWPSCCSPS